MICYGNDPNFYSAETISKRSHQAAYRTSILGNPHATSSGQAKIQDPGFFYYKTLSKIRNKYRLIDSEIILQDSFHKAYNKVHNNPSAKNPNRITQTACGHTFQILNRNSRAAEETGLNQANTFLVRRGVGTNRALNPKAKKDNDNRLQQQYKSKPVEQQAILIQNNYTQPILEADYPTFKESNMNTQRNIRTSLPKQKRRTLFDTTAQSNKKHGTSFLQSHQHLQFRINKNNPSFSYQYTSTPRPRLEDILNEQRRLDKHHNSQKRRKSQQARSWSLAEEFGVQPQTAYRNAVF